MSGHSKWHTIKHAKEAADAKRGAAFTKLTREIIIAVREGGASTDANYRLRLAVQKARDSNMPMDNIDRAISKGSGATSGGMVEMVMEGYGPGGVAIMVNATTDNHNRAVQEIRNVFNRSGGSLGENGCVSWLFQSRGVITVKLEKGMDPDELGLKAIDAGADDVATEGDYVEIFTRPDALEAVRKALVDQKVAVESAEVSMIAKQMVALEEKAAFQTLRMLEKLEELDDVQSVASNADFSDDIVEKYHSGARLNV